MEANMKRRFIFLLLIPLLLLASCNSELLPQALASATQAIVGDVKEDNDDVFAEIQRNLDLVTELKAKVQESQMDGNTPSLDSVIRDIEKVAQSYEKLAGQRDDIRKGILQKIKRVENMRITVDSEIRILRERMAIYSKQLSLVSNSNPDIARTRKESLTRAIGYVGGQIHLWQEFSSIEWGILIEMSEIQRTLDSFLSMIESSAILFREGLNLLYLKQDINEAINLFASDIPRMEQLTEDMEQSWITLDYLIETLTGVANIDIAQ